MTKQILVIDDEAAVRMTIERVLFGLGYSVTCASNGLEGIRLFRSLRPDVVITDIIMPKQEGIETILAIRQEQPKAKIIAMSGGGRIDSANLLTMAQRLGADHVIAKPFNIDRLISVIQRALLE